MGSLKKYTVNKPEIVSILIFLLLIGSIVLGVILFNRHETNLNKLTASDVTCTYLEGRGYYNITRSSPYYQKHLDANHNGIACQKH